MTTTRTAKVQRISDDPQLLQDAILPAMPDDSTTRIILEQIGSRGYTVTVTADAVVAVDALNVEQHRVTFDDGDRQRAACQLARLVSAL